MYENPGWPLPPLPTPMPPINFEKKFLLQEVRTSANEPPSPLSALENLPDCGRLLCMGSPLRFKSRNSKVYNYRERDRPPSRGFKLTDLYEKKTGQRKSNRAHCCPHHLLVMHTHFKTHGFSQWRGNDVGSYPVRWSWSALTHFRLQLIEIVFHAEIYSKICLKIRYLKKL